MKRILLVLPIFVLLAAGCHAQLPVSTYSIAYNATAPSVCTAANPCVITVSDVVESGGSCPATNAANYAAACTIASGATSCTHAAVTAGVTYCAINQVTQGGANSGPSPAITVAVPPLPPVPAAPTGTAVPVTVAKADVPLAIEEQRLATIELPSRPVANAQLYAAWTNWLDGLLGQVSR